MPAIGKNTGRVFLEQEILSPPDFLKMLEEPLFREGEDGEQVGPVRNQGSPYFRAPPGQRRVGTGERNSAHTDCIAAFHQALQEGAVKISTSTFIEGTRFPVGQVFFQTKEAKEYRWWTDSSGTRIPLGAGKYIQPDICGRESNPSAFSAGPKSPNVINEVIQKHYPEEDTLYELIRLSECNHIVVFFFIRSPYKSSKYSSFRRIGTSSLLGVSAVHILHQGHIYINGMLRFEPPSADRELFRAWYAKVEASFFLPVMREKEVPPPAKNNAPKEQT